MPRARGRRHVGVTGQAVAERARRAATRGRRCRRRRRDARAAIARPVAVRRTLAALDDVDVLVPEPGRPRAPSRVRRGDAGRGMPVRQRVRPGGRLGHRRRPVLAVTGTDGKTTVTTLVTDMLARVRAARRSPSATPRCRSSPRSTPTSTCSWSRRRRSGSDGRSGFAPTVATWLNFAPDHLDLHGSVGRVRGRQGPHLSSISQPATSRSPTPTIRW